MSSSLIITLKLDEDTQVFFNDLRKTYYPAHCNHVQAHCTLLHKLTINEEQILQILLPPAQRSIIKMEVTSVDHRGNAVMYSIQSEELQQLHAALQIDFKPWLIRRDRQLLKPHITVQNKVTDFKAFSLHKRLATSFNPMIVYGTGFTVWRYLKPGWIHVADIGFTLSS